MTGRGERGAGTVLTLAVCAGLATVMFIAAILISWFAQIRHAEQAAELAALAAVGAAVNGGDPCSSAERVAHANHAALSGCRVQGTAPDVVVVAEIMVDLRSSGPLENGGEIVRQATAGTR